MKQFATRTVIGRDETGVVARFTSFLFAQHANVEAVQRPTNENRRDSLKGRAVFTTLICLEPEATRR